MSHLTYKLTYKYLWKKVCAFCWFSAVNLLSIMLGMNNIKSLTFAVILFVYIYVVGISNIVCL
jgi:hypothetical protein